LSFKEQTIVTGTSGEQEGFKESRFSFSSKDAAQLGDSMMDHYISEVLKKANMDHIQQEIIYLKAENEKIHQLLKEIVPTDEIKKRTFNILTEVLCKNCEHVFTLYEELRVKDIKQESK